MRSIERSPAGLLDIGMPGLNGYEVAQKSVKPCPHRRCA